MSRENEVHVVINVVFWGVKWASSGNVPLRFVYKCRIFEEVKGMYLEPLKTDDWNAANSKSLK